VFADLNQGNWKSDADRPDVEGMFICLHTQHPSTGRKWRRVTVVIGDDGDGRMVSDASLIARRTIVSLLEPAAGAQNGGHTKMPLRDSDSQFKRACARRLL
jgi:hypothetical protein